MKEEITFDQLARELHARDDQNPTAEAIELTLDELMVLRGHKDSIRGGWFDPPMSGQPEKLLGLPIRVVKAPGAQRIVPPVGHRP